MAWKNTTEMTTEENHSSTINLIGSGTLIKGDVSSDGDLRIDGKVIGTITSKSKVVVGAGGSVEGEIKSQNADIYGTLKGNVTVQEMIFLKSTANLLGDITTNKIVIEAGAIFKGRCNMGSPIPSIETIKTDFNIAPVESISSSTVSGSNNNATSKGFQKSF